MYLQLFTFSVESESVFRDIVYIKESSSELPDHKAFYSKRESKVC